MSREDWSRELVERSLAACVVVRSERSRFCRRMRSYREHESKGLSWIRRDRHVMVIVGPRVLLQTVQLVGVDRP